MRCRAARRRVEGARRACTREWQGEPAVVELLADTLALPRAGVSIVSGHGSRDKTVALQGIDPEQTERLLAEASAAGKDPE